MQTLGSWPISFMVNVLRVWSLIHLFYLHIFHLLSFLFFTTCAACWQHVRLVDCAYCVVNAMLMLIMLSGSAHVLQSGRLFTRRSRLFAAAAAASFVLDGDFAAEDASLCTLHCWWRWWTIFFFYEGHEK